MLVMPAEPEARANPNVSTKQTDNRHHFPARKGVLLDWKLSRETFYAILIPPPDVD